MVHATDACRENPTSAPPQPYAVTLVFKDGRPSEQIHNYLLTRTTLYVQDQHRRDIALDQLDLSARYATHPRVNLGPFVASTSKLPTT